MTPPADRAGGGEVLAACGLPPEAFPRQFFARALSRGRLSHAYLFIGPPDSSRRRFARELAKAIFCKSGAPCGGCSSCLAIEHGNHGGVFLYGPDEGKSTVEISKVRDLEERVHLRREDFLVAIIDEADRLSLPAANAVLKTLEEPTGSTLMILITESSGGLLPTIVSRCHRILFPAPCSPSDSARGPVPTDAAPQNQGRSLDGSLDRALAELAEPGFFADREPRSWLSGHLSGETNARELVRAFLDRLLHRGRALWASDFEEGGEAARRNEEAARAVMEELLDLRADIDRNVHPDLVLEAVFALISPHC